MAHGSTHDVDVLIAGAGPTGLVLALWLTKLGVSVRIVNKTAEPGTTSRALAVTVRTLELYRQIGLAESLINGGVKIPARTSGPSTEKLRGYRSPIWAQG